jgi:pimeloyl-ACP methyl ester carboxylesterase
VWSRLPLGLLAFADFVAAGALRGYARTNWRYALFFLYPYLLLLMMVLASCYAGEFAARMSGSIAIGIAAGVLALVACYLGPGRWTYLPLALDDWIFARAYIRHTDPELERRLDAAADEIIAAARARSVDEILLLGHSLGAVLAVDVLDRALRREPDLGTRGPRLALVTAGSSILKIGLHRAATRLRDALARVSRSPGVFWVEYQALTDIMNFYKTDPVRECGLEPTDRPVIRRVRISHMLEPDNYRRVRRNFYRLHCQFVSGNDRRAIYDYFMLVCGPLPAEQQARLHEGAGSEIGDDGRLLHAALHSVARG